MTSGKSLNKRTRALLFVLVLAAIVLLVFAFFNRQIHNDEAWIGQQVWSLEHNGKVTSDLFRDCPPLDQEIVVIHKLLVWSGLAVSAVFSWGLYQLRAISFFAGLITLLLVFWFARKQESSPYAWRVLFILLLAPIFWLQMLEFRPESLLILCGLTSYFVLVRSRTSNTLLLPVVAGIFAGLAGLSHAFGMVFVIGGFVALLSDKRPRAAFVFLIAGLAAFAPYLSGYFTQRELFLVQTIHNPLMTTSFDFHWWQPAVNLVTEHKRLLRKPEVIGLTVWTLISLLFVNRDFWRGHRFLFVYVIAIEIALAISPLPKFTRYMIPLVPFMALFIAEVWSNIEALGARRPRIISRVFTGWMIIYFAYGSYALVAEAIPQHTDQIKTNAVIAEQMEPKSLVMAPFDFVFMQQGKFTIQSWWGAERAAGEYRSLPFLERYADSLGVRYIILDQIERDIWKIDENRLTQDFTKYGLIFSLPEQHRYVLRRISSD
jgi:4-amino-4-deoxy-L-arabinose transferase-like glycosyltransferase